MDNTTTLVNGSTNYSYSNGTDLTTSDTTDSIRSSPPSPAIDEKDIVKSGEPNVIDDLVIDTSQLRERYKFFEEFKEDVKEPKRFEMTPPRDASVVKEDSPAPLENGHRDPNVIRSSEVVDDIPKTDTAKKMLAKFKQLESQQSVEVSPSGPKPLKSITPPRELNGNIDQNGKDFSPDRDHASAESDQLITAHLKTDNLRDEGKQLRNEMIIRENIPKELPPDVIRSHSRVDDGLDALQLDLGNIRQQFERPATNGDDKSATPGSVSDISALKRSESILIRLKRYQSAIAGERNMSQNGEDRAASSGDESSDDEINENGPTRENKKKEVAVPFTGLSSLKSQWESGSVAVDNDDGLTSKDVKAETKEELYKIRQRICLGRSASMRQVYEKGVPSENGHNGSCRSDTVVIGSRLKAVFIKEKFEKGEIENEQDEKRMAGMKREKLEDLSVVTESETAAREAKSLFKQMDIASKNVVNGNAVRNGSSPHHGYRNGLSRSSTTGSFRSNPVSPVIEANDIVRPEAAGAKEEVVIEESHLQERYKFFEDFKENAKEPKRFEMTPPRDASVVKEDSPAPLENGHRDPNVIRSSDVVDDIPKTDTAKKMLGRFKQLESQQSVEVAQSGPKPLKRITPPRELTENNNIDQNGKEPLPLADRDANIVRGTYKSEDGPIPVEPEMARSLKAKFENWANEIERENHKNSGLETEVEDFTPQLDTAKNLKAKFEAIKLENKPAEKPKPKVNRFVQDTSATQGEGCSICGKRVYPLEKLEFNGVKLHKTCFKCSHCSSSLRIENYTFTAGKFYCIAHFKQLFMAKGNYDEGFGREQHKEKWNSRASSRNQTPDELEFDSDANSVENVIA